MCENKETYLEGIRRKWNKTQQKKEYSQLISEKKGILWGCFLQTVSLFPYGKNNIP